MAMTLYSVHCEQVKETFNKLVILTQANTWHVLCARTTTIDGPFFFLFVLFLVFFFPVGSWL